MAEAYQTGRPACLKNRTILSGCTGYPNYYRLNDKRVFSIFAYSNLVAALGGADPAGDERR